MTDCILCLSRTSKCRAHRKRRRQSAAGFTLIELMITVAIIAIIVAVAMPAYQSYTRDARRAAAVSLLADLASRQEQFFLDNRTYTNNLVSLGVPSGTLTTDGGQYTLTVTAASATAFTLQATPTTNQTTSQCGNLTLDNNLTKTPAACFTK